MLVGALHRASIGARCPLKIVTSEWTRWSSATFNGARHISTWLAAPSAALDTWLLSLPDVEFALRGNLVADIALASISRTPHRVEMKIEALTVEV